MSHVLKDFRTFRASADIYGVEWLFVYTILFLRIVSLSYWLRCCLPSARGDRRWLRDTVIEFYCAAQALILLGLLALHSQRVFAVMIAAYILFDLFLGLANVIFVGKFPHLQALPASIERSIILLMINIVVVVLAFAVFYQYTLGLSMSAAVLQASLVLGTVGYPSDLKGKAQLLVVLQIALDLALTVLLLSSFVGQIGLFRRAAPHASIWPASGKGVSQNEPRV